MILECGHEPTEQAPGHLGTGYGQDDKGQRACYQCCAYMDKATMIEDGRITLYLRYDTSKHSILDHKARPIVGVQNWPGSLLFNVFPGVRHSKTNGFGSMQPRVDLWFVGPDGFVWHGRHQGRHNDLVNCKRTRERWTHWVDGQLVRVG